MLQHGKRPTIASRHGMVAAAHPLAAAAGARILSSGGNAFDAAAATAAMLNVVEPYMSGLAGMGMATCYVAREKRVRSLNFMARIPRAFPLDRLERREQVLRGPIAVGAPGNLAGWCEMVSSYGTRKLPELFAPAIAVARDGFGLLEFNVEEIAGVTPELRGHGSLYPEWSRNYLDGIAGGRPALGAVLRQPDLARTLEALGNEGDTPVLALGTPGSYGILQTQPQAFVQYVDFGLPLHQAIEAPRARLTDGRAVLLESRVDADVRAALRTRGHDLSDGPDWTMKVGGMQGVALKDGTYTGGCDPRRDGYCVPA